MSQWKKKLRTIKRPFEGKLSNRNTRFVLGKTVIEGSLIERIIESMLANKNNAN